MKVLKIAIVFFLGISSLYSQHKINGKIIDENKMPLAFANIILYQVTDSKNPKGSVSNETGAFLIDGILSGKYRIEVSMLGFKTHTINEFDLVDNKTFNITLKEETQLLNEVVIESKRPVIKQTAEKLIVDLEKSEMINSNLEDVMRKVPGVLVTNNGISIAGKRGVRILINGKTTAYMDVETLLRDFPADNIAKIEVLEQPGAEYEASGTGAIINIILKKNVKLGTHGSVNSWIGEDVGVEWGSGFSIASYKNQLNWQISSGFSQTTWRDDLYLVRTVGDKVYDQITREPYDPNNFRIGGNVDYYINKYHSIGLSGRINKRDSDRILSSRTIISNGENSNRIFSENSFDLERSNYNLNPYYEYKTDTDKLTLDFNFISFEEKTINSLYSLENSDIPFSDRKYDQDGNYSIKTYRVDYSKSLNDYLKLSIGSRYADVKTTNDLQSFLKNNMGSFELILDESSKFLIDETIFALYSKINTSFGKWSFSGGLRYENSNTDGTSVFVDDDLLTTEIKKRPIKKIFPSASISKELSENLGASLSYSYRIQRPSYNSLNSFATFLDPYSAGEGNPNLAPSYTNNFQFNLTYEGQPFFTIGYSKTDDVIFELIRQDNTTAQIRQQEVNVENNENWNFRLFAPINFTKGLEGFTGIIVTNSDFESSTFNVDLNKWNLIWFIQASYQLPWNINFEVSGNYGTGALEGQIEVDWLADLEFSFGKKFLEDKLKMNLGFSKILNRGFVGNIDYGNGVADVISIESRNNVQFRLVYSFGSEFAKKKSNRDINKDEENRIQNSN